VKFGPPRKEIFNLVQILVVGLAIEALQVQ